jgi:hypothetical protein
VGVAARREAWGRPRERRDATGYVFPPVRFDRWEYQDRVAEELEAIARALPYGKKRKSLLRRATAFALCGRRTKVKSCKDCGAHLPGSGVQASSGHPCGLRVCNVCARRESGRVCAELEPVLASITTDASGGYRYRSITLTTRYDPTDPAELTIEAIRERVVGLRRAVSHVWAHGLRDACNRRGKKRGGTGLVYNIEIGMSGAVHVHCVYWGPYAPNAWLVTCAREAYDRVGHVHHVAEIRGPDLSRKVREACKYGLKGISPLCERWFDEPREVMHPRLVARWEAATDGVHLHGRFGRFRQKIEESEEVEAPKPEEPPCPCCGSRAGYDIVDVDTRWWVQHCHSRGLRAFDGSRVEPIPRARLYTEPEWGELMRRMAAGLPLDASASPANETDRERFVI